MGNQQAKIEKQLSWLGGIIDGEGSIMILKQNIKWKRGDTKVSDIFLRPAIKISNTDKEGLQTIMEILDKQELPYHISWRHPKKAYKESWMITVAGIKRCISWYQILKDYVVWKKGELQTLMDFCQSRLEREREFSPGFNSHARYPKYNDRELADLQKLSGRRLGTRLL